MKSIILHVNNLGVAWSNTERLPWQKTNLPKDSFRFREQEPIYWEVKLLGFNAETGLLQVEIIDYWQSEASFNPNLAPKQRVNALAFAPLKQEDFKAQLNYYKQGVIAPFLETVTSPNNSSLAPAPAASTETDFEVTTSAPLQPYVRTILFTIPILELTFTDGSVQGIADLPGLVDILPFSITNDHLVAEFETIKPYFVKALKRKTIEVKAVLNFIQGEPQLTKVTSAQIDKIDDEMLEVFRARSLRNLLSPERVRTVDKSLFTPEDVFESLDDELGKAVLPKEGVDLLAEILRRKKVRNAKQLTFLAGRLHTEGQKLRYVLSPKFGFVFLAKGQDANHFILELLNSHATYIWSIPKGWKTIAEQYHAVEREIQVIGLQGRGQYRRTLHFEHEFWFVIHENADSGVVDGFPRWKNRLLEGLI